MQKRRVEVSADSEHEVLPRGMTSVSWQIQAKIAQLGASLGFNNWIPRTDRSRVLRRLPVAYHPSIVTPLPVRYDAGVQTTIENIDVIWLQGRAIARAFEVEHRTSIYSGLLRMADLLAMQPGTNIPLHIVAPKERRDQVRREITRPALSMLEGGTMVGRCSFLSYEAVDEMIAQKNLAHMKETILEEYEEYFAAI